MAVALQVPQKALLLLIVLLVLVLIGGAAYAYLPSAEIEIHPAVVDKTVTKEITLSASATEPDFVGFVLPAKVVSRDIVEEQFISREASELFDDFATGTVVLKNEQASEQRLLPQTHLRHEESGVFFLTDERVVIPPQGEVVVGVTAKEKGAGGNVFPGRFIVDKLPVSTQQVVYGEGTDTFAGGVAVSDPLSEEELNAARADALRAARERALAELTVEAGGAFLREDLTEFEEGEVISSASAGSVANGYSVRAQVTARSFIVDENDLLSLTLLELRRVAGAEEEFVTYDPRTFSVTITRSDFERGEAVVRGELTGSFATKLGPTVLAGENLAGLTVAEAQEALQKLPGVGEVSIALSPFWVSTIPSRSDAVSIVISNQ